MAYDWHKSIMQGVIGGAALLLAPFAMGLFGYSLTITPPGLIPLFVAGFLLNVVLEPLATALLRGFK